MKMVMPVKTEVIDKLHVKVYQTREDMGRAAAYDIAAKIRELQAQKDKVRIIFAAAPSQKEMLAYLCKEMGIDWSKIEVMHMDEYIGLNEGAPQLFSRFLCQHLFDIVKPGKVQLINSQNGIQEECIRYSQIINREPIDIVCLGIGENGHIAFNDPPVADFNDSKIVKPVELDSTCRNQQVHDGCFSTLEEVPTRALTLTIPTLMSGNFLYCVVPGITKRNAVQKTLTSDVSTSCPATILRTHQNCTLYADNDSYRM